MNKDAQGRRKVERSESNWKCGVNPAANRKGPVTWSRARISHHLTVEARDKPAITSLRLLAVLNVLFNKYASARRAARALY